MGDLGGGVTSEAVGTLGLSREAGALALVTLVNLRGGGEGVLHGGGVTSEAEGGVTSEAGGEGLMVTSDLVPADVVQREADCDEDEEIVRVAKSQSPLTHRNLMGMGGSMELSGLRLLFLLTLERVVSASQDSSSVAGAGVESGNRVEFCSGLKQVTSPLISISVDSRTKFIIDATSTPPVSVSSLRI